MQSEISELQQKAIDFANNKIQALTLSKAFKFLLEISNDISQRKKLAYGLWMKADQNPKACLAWAKHVFSVFEKTRSHEVRSHMISIMTLIPVPQAFEKLKAMLTKDLKAKSYMKTYILQAICKIGSQDALEFVHAKLCSDFAGDFMTWEAFGSTENDWVLEKLKEILAEEVAAKKINTFILRAISKHGSIEAMALLKQVIENADLGEYERGQALQGLRAYNNYGAIEYIFEILESSESLDHLCYQAVSALQHTAMEQPAVREQIYKRLFSIATSKEVVTNVRHYCLMGLVRFEKPEHVALAKHLFYNEKEYLLRSPAVCFLGQFTLEEQYDIGLEFLMAEAELKNHTAVVEFFGSKKEREGGTVLKLLVDLVKNSIKRLCSRNQSHYLALEFSEWQKAAQLKEHAFLMNLKKGLG